MALARCEYPYIFGNAISTKGVANAQDGSGITGAQTTNWALDDVSQSVAYSNGTGQSSSSAKGESSWTRELGGASTGATSGNTGEGNALTDSVSKSFNPSARYYAENYADYIDFLNGLFQKYPEKRADILKIVQRYSDAVNTGSAPTAPAAAPAAAAPAWPAADGYPAALGNFNDPTFQAIGQTTFDYQRGRASGLQSGASSNSGSYRWNNATVHQGNANANSKRGWATVSADDYGYGRVNYVNSAQNAGAYGDDAQSRSNSNYYLAQGTVWNNGDAQGRAQGRDSYAFSDLNGNSYGYGAVNGNTDSYSDGNLATSRSQIVGAPAYAQ